MTAVLVDANVLLDIMTGDARWAAWSAHALAEAADRSRLVINPIVYAEISVRFSRIEDLESALPTDMIEREPYRRRAGAKTSPLPDFFIGAHAAVAGYSLLTRDATRYRTYFPKASLIAPA